MRHAFPIARLLLTMASVPLAGCAGWMLARSADVPCRLVHVANDVSPAVFARPGEAVLQLRNGRRWCQTAVRVEKRLHEIEPAHARSTLQIERCSTAGEILGRFRAPVRQAAVDERVPVSGALRVDPGAMCEQHIDERLLQSATHQVPSSWSLDGRYIVYENADPKTQTDLWILPLFGGRKPLPFLITEFSEAQGQLSPNGRWMAYTSNESGKNEIYVQPFPPSSPGPKWTISPRGGRQPHWRRDGKELFYLEGTDSTSVSVMAVWTGPEQQGYQAVLDGLSSKERHAMAFNADSTGNV